jgi:hypothetical protein
MKIAVYCNVTPYTLVNADKHFGETGCLQLSDRKVSTSQGPTSQKTVFSMAMAVRFSIQM